MTPLNTPITPTEHEKLTDRVTEWQNLADTTDSGTRRRDLRALIAEAEPRLAASCFVPIAAGGSLGYEPAPGSICVVRIRDNDEDLTLICRWGDAGGHLVIDHTYTITVGHMSQASFDALPEFEG